MKVKIEFTNGNIEATEVMGVTIYREQGIVFTTCANSRHKFHCKLEKVSRITADNEIIYDFMSRKERYKKEEAKENKGNIKKHRFGIE